MALNETRIPLRNGVTLPTVGYGTGIVRAYYRNKTLYFKSYLRPILWSLKHCSMNRKLMGDFHSVQIIRAAYDAGFRLFDSARIYGHSELFIGKALRKMKRCEYFLCSKISDMDIDRISSPDTVRENLYQSLRYFRTSYIDCYLLHWPQGNWIDIYKQMESMYQEGKVRALGVCNFNVENFEQLLEHCEVTPHICQTELHPLNSKPELRRYCEKKGIVLMAHTPLGRMRKEIQENSTLLSLSKKYSRSVSQIILKWHEQNNVIPIIATYSRKHMQEDTSLDGFSLTTEELSEINALDEGYAILTANGIDDPNFIYNL